MTKPTLRVLMLGAGTQSTVMALMADRGEFGSRPDCAIFSDTGDERDATYAVLDWLDTKLSYPIHRADAGLKLSDGMIQMLRPSGGTVIEAPPDKYAIPAFLRDRATDKKSMSKRFCTSEYKVKPGDKLQRELLGVPKGQRVPKDTIGGVLGLQFRRTQSMQRPETPLANLPLSAYRTPTKTPSSNRPVAPIQGRQRPTPRPFSVRVLPVPIGERMATP